MENLKEVPISYRFHEFNKMFINCVKKEAEMNGINPTYRFIFLALANAENGLTQTEICDLVHLKAPSISLTLQQMENEKLISRSKSTIDNRQIIVKLTDNGQKLNKKLKQIFEKWEKKVEKVLSIEELNTLNDSMAKIKEVLSGGEEHV